MEHPVNDPAAPQSDGRGAPSHYLGASAGNAGPAGAPFAAPNFSGLGLRRIGIYGGSFDPVHRGHLHVAAEAQGARGLERVVFLPAAQPPHKPDQILASGADRVAMLRMAVAGRDDWSVDGLELERSGLSYTIDTVNLVRRRWGLDPEARLFLILGSDNLRGFAQWKDAALLLERTEPVVVPRERDLGPTLTRLHTELSPDLARRLERSIVDTDALLVSSSGVREALARGVVQESTLPPGVLEYIRARGIYGAQGAQRAPGAPGQGTD